MKLRTAPFTLAAGSLILMFAAGCETPPEKTAQKPQNSKDEYVTVAPEIGSRVPKRVKKSELKDYRGMAPTQNGKITAETDTNNAPPMTSGEMEKIVAPSK